jgi:glucose-6-phosphate 1-epimerase
MTELKKLENGFEYIEVVNASAKAKIALQGAHIFEFTCRGKEDLLWLSESSDFELGEAIRGGIPICWPSFGTNNPDLPQHGFARVSIFQLISATDLDADTTELIFKLTSSQESLRLWDYKFELEVKIVISDSLIISLKTTNLDKKEFKLTQALHTYFSISDILHVEIDGLDTKPYFDALTSSTCRQDGKITFNQEFDAVFQEVESEILLKDAPREISIKNEGSSSVVVWNPWIEKCSRMSAMESEAYREFVCIESANAFDDFKILEPNTEHILSLVLKLKSL